MRHLILVISIIAIFFTGCSQFSVGQSENQTGLEGKKVSTYLMGRHIDVETAKEKLTNAGFEIITTYESIKNSTTIIFTNSLLKKEAADTGVANIAVLRLFIDNQNKMISMTNPIYFAKAYMQDKYNHTVINSVLERIKVAMPDLQPSHDALNFDDLSEYHYMTGMPYYADVTELGVGSNEELLERARNFQNGNSLVFELKLSENSYLLGYDLGRRTKKFVKKIGRANAAVLPYTITIQNSKATALDAKYYLALYYPLLSLTQFMTISTVPGAIVEDLKRPFIK